MISFLKGLSLGAGVIYLMDPERGDQRRQALTAGLTDTTQGLNQWVGHAMTDSVPNTLGLAAAAMGGLVGLKFFARRPMTTLALAAAGIMVAKQLQEIEQNHWAQSRGHGHGEGRGRGLAPLAAATGSYREAPRDLAEMAHYGNAGNGHSGGKHQNEDRSDDIAGQATS